MSNIDKYPDKPAFAGLILIMPATIVLLSIMLRAVDSELLYRALFDIKKFINPYIVMNITSLLSLVICFGVILHINSRRAKSSDEELFIIRKSFLNLSLIFVNVCYIIFIYVYHDLEKLGNIPVGRD